MWGPSRGTVWSHQPNETLCSISNLTGFYKDAKKRFDEDEEFNERAHREVVALQVRCLTM